VAAQLEARSRDGVAGQQDAVPVGQDAPKREELEKLHEERMKPL